MNQKNEHSSRDQRKKTYVEWDESVIFPSRKIRHQKKHEIKHGEFGQFEHKEPEFQQIKIGQLEEKNSKPKSHNLNKQLTGEALRNKRMKYVRTIRFLRTVRHIFFRTFLCIAILFVSFWWKFVYVYDLPSYVQQQFPKTTAFIAWKAWSFGPPIIDLKSYGNPTNQMEMTRYLIRMDSYKDIVIHPIIIWSFKKH